MIQLILLAGAVALLYNGAVDRYGDWKMQRMATIPPLEVPICDGGCGDPSLSLETPTELRRTVSSRSGLVERSDERSDDRRAWNAWLLSPLPSIDTLTPGIYTFQCRSHVNCEESGAIKKSPCHIPAWFGFVGKGRGTLAVQPGGISAVLKDTFLKRLTPVTMTWNGASRRQDTGASRQLCGPAQK